MLVDSATRFTSHDEAAERRPVWVGDTGGHFHLYWVDLSLQELDALATWYGHPGIPCHGYEIQEFLNRVVSENLAELVPKRKASKLRVRVRRS